MKKFSIIQPDDWHLHLRDGNYLQTTVPAAARYFARALVMPNLKPPVTSIEDAKQYQQRILTAVPKNSNFQPLMTLYLTESMTPEFIAQVKQSHQIIAFKLYPAGATTHSAAGVANIEKIYPVLAAMEEHDIPLCIHAETTLADIDIFEREKYFLENTVAIFIKKFPRLRIIIEHVSSAFAVDWIKSAPQNIAATITAHHLLLNRNDLLVGGIHPHYYCLPIVKTSHDQEALIRAAISGNPKFFLGTDSAPHPKSQKESACGCAGIFTGFSALELYTEVFEQANALDKLEGFASIYGADFYQLPRNTKKINLVKESWQLPATLPFASEQVVPLHAGESIHWKVI